MSFAMPGGAELSEKLPDELFQLVESFKRFIREQKAYRDQKFDADTIIEIGHETEEFVLAFQRLAVDSDRNAKLVQQIKDDTTRLLRHAELAYSSLKIHMANNPAPSQQQQAQQQQQQQQHSTQQLLHPQPYNLDQTQTHSSQQQQPQLTNTTYFEELADQLETRMKLYGEHIKELKLSVDSLSRPYNVDELFKWLKKQHETVGEIAAKIYMIHERVMDRGMWRNKSMGLETNHHQ